VSAVTVSYAVARRGLPGVASFRRWIDAALAGARRAGAKQAAVDVRVVGQAEGRKLNRAWRRRDYATNVLSFPAAPAQGAKGLPLGDLVLCAPVVAREAREQGKAPHAHWAHLTVHGTLHLLGHDHESSAEAERMEALERRILARLGFPDPYETEG
jgi:probable rRNA maturation factor